MSEADWWLCPRCSSLNNLAARKCYSCDLRKPKNAVRASQHLGYVPVVSWDGKVTLEQIRAERPDAPSEVARPQAPVAPTPPPLREPVPRSILAVAPRPPNPARITFGVDAPPSTPVPVVAVGPGAPIPPASARELWPHWQELLDGPVPEAERLRETADEGAGQASQSSGGGPASRSSLALWSAMRQARAGDSSSRTFTPWPKADRPQQQGEGPGEIDAGRLEADTTH